MSLSYLAQEAQEITGGGYGAIGYGLAAIGPGIGVGIAITSRSGAVRVLAPLIGYACAVAAHSLWNGSTLLAGGAGFFGVYLLAMVPAFISLVALATWARSREARILEGALHDAASRGLMPYGDIPHIVDLGARRRARQFAWTHGGEQGLGAMRAYQQAAVELPRPDEP